MMLRKFFSLIIFLCTVTVSLAQQKKNVLVIITDDQTYQTIHALGNKEIVTPTMDKLVKNGTSFTNAHIMGALNGAVCQPSRAMILCGKTLFHIRKDGAYIPESDITFPQLFKENGYLTFQTGKWHQDTKSLNRSFAAGENIHIGGMNPPDNGGQYRPEL